MVGNADQIVKRHNRGDVDSLAWAACAAHRFAMRTALAPRPLHQGDAMGGEGAGLASQLNPLAPQTPEGLVEQRRAAHRCGVAATSRTARTRQGAATRRLGASSVGPVASGYAPSLRPSETGVSRLPRTIVTRGVL